MARIPYRNTKEPSPQADEQTLDKEEVKMHTRTNSPEFPAQTERRLICWASFYDGLAIIMTKRHTLTKPVATLLIENGEQQP